MKNILISPLFLVSSLPETQSTALNHLQTHSGGPRLHAIAKLHPHWPGRFKATVKPNLLFGWLYHRCSSQTTDQGHLLWSILPQKSPGECFMVAKDINTVDEANAPQIKGCQQSFPSIHQRAPPECSKLSEELLKALPTFPLMWKESKQGVTGILLYCSWLSCISQVSGFLSHLQEIGELHVTLIARAPFNCWNHLVVKSAFTINAECHLYRVLTCFMMV